MDSDNMEKLSSSQLETLIEEKEAQVLILNQEIKNLKECLELKQTIPDDLPSKKYILVPEFLDSKVKQWNYKRVGNVSMNVTVSLHGSTYDRRLDDIDWDDDTFYISKIAPNSASSEFIFVSTDSCLEFDQDTWDDISNDNYLVMYDPIQDPDFDPEDTPMEANEHEKKHQIYYSQKTGSHLVYYSTLRLLKMRQGKEFPPFDNINPTEIGDYDDPIEVKGDKIFIAYLYMTS